MGAMVNIDVLDEDGASNIAHPEQFEKEKSVYWGNSPVAQTKVYEKSDFSCSYCGRSDQFKQAADFHAQHCSKK